MKELNHANESYAQIALKELLRGLEPARAAVLMTVCQRYNLDPVLKHAVLVAGNLYITRDGLLQVAHASGQLDGIEVEIAENGEWAEATVYRKDMSHPFRYRVHRAEYDTRKGAWATHPLSMLVKVAEVFALRRAFPVGLTPIEEMERVVDVVVESPHSEFTTEEHMPEEAAVSADNMICAECGASLRKPQYTISMAKYQRALCPTCQRNAARVAVG